MKSNKFRKISKYYIQYFIIGSIIFGIISLFMKDVNLLSRIIFVLIPAIGISILFGTVLLLSNKIIRPKIQNKCLNNRNFKEIEKIGLEFNDKALGYFGTYRDYDVQVVYYYDEFDILTSEFVINVFFQRQEITKDKKKKLKDTLSETNIGEVAIQRTFRFKLFLTGKFKFTDSIDKMIDFLIAEKYRPIRLSDLEKEFNENVA